MGGASARQLQSRCKMYSCFCKSTKMYIQLRVPGTSTLRAILWWASLWWRALSLPVERFFDSRSAGQGWCSSSLWLRNTAIRTLFPSAWWRWYSVPISIEFPSKGNVSGYTCNHDSLRIGNEMLRLLAILRAFLSASPLKKRGWRVPQAPFYSRRRSFAYVIGFHLPMSSALCVFISCFRHRSHWRRSHKWPLEDAASRSLFSGNHGYMCNLRRSASGCPHTRLRLLNSGEKTIFERTHVSLADRKHGRVLREWMNPLVSREICACAFNALSHRLMS